METRSVDTDAGAKNRGRRGPVWRLAVGLVVTALTLYLAFRRVQWPQIFETLRTLDAKWIIFGVVLFVTSLVVRAIRWQVLLQPVSEGKPRLTDTFSYLMIGYAANNIMPMRTGELVRAYYAAQEEHTKTSGVLATIVVERTFDLLGLIIFVILLTATMQIPAAIQTSMMVVEILAVLALGLLIAFSSLDPGSKRLRSVLGRVLPERIVEKGLALLETFLVGLQSLRSRRALLSVFVLSMLIWLLVFCDAFLYMKAFHFDLPFIAAVFVVTIANLGTMIPSAPGGIGVAHFLFVVALGVWGIAREPALGFAVVRHGMVYTLTTGIGLACLWLRHLPFKAIGIGTNDPLLSEEDRSRGS